MHRTSQTVVCQSSLVTLSAVVDPAGLTGHRGVFATRAAVLEVFKSELESVKVTKTDVPANHFKIDHAMNMSVPSGLNGPPGQSVLTVRQKRTRLVVSGNDFDFVASKMDAQVPPLNTIRYEFYFALM